MVYKASLLPFCVKLRMNRLILFCTSEITRFVPHTNVLLCSVPPPSDIASESAPWHHPKSPQIRSDQSAPHKLVSAYREPRSVRQTQPSASLRSISLTCVTAIGSPAATERGRQNPVPHMGTCCATWNGGRRQRAGRLLCICSTIFTTVDKSCW